MTDLSMQRTYSWENSAATIVNIADAPLTRLEIARACGYRYAGDVSHVHGKPQ